MVKYLVNSDMHKHDKMYGTTTMGARGQVVIPAQARKDLGLKPGDQLMVMGKFGKVLGLMKAEQLSEVIDTIMESVDSKEWKKEIKKHMEKVIGSKVINN
jgi:AbrB family looped-hinge helix DNA binding protein